MICPECGREMKRVCDDCRKVRARRGLLLHQRRFLQTWLAGQIELRVREQAGALHLELFDDRWHSYCGIAMFKLTDRQRLSTLPADICANCKLIFEDLVAAAKC